MNIFRNPEVRRELLLYIVISVIGTGAAYRFAPQFANFTLVLCLAFMIVYLVSTYRRYQRIRNLAAAVNQILHGDEAVSLEDYSEGELAILHSEIYKMTVRLREQQQKLIKDKVYLADSIADISHQVRTPLTSINLLVQFLSEPNLTEERRLKLTRELYGLLSRIDWLITSLLKMSKLDAGTVQFKEERISLQSLISKACAPILVPIELRGQTLVINAEGDFNGDVSWTCEALGNIVKNCMEHTPEGGRIEISASENALYTLITIQDNGSGIAGEDLQHIFERFYKGKNSDDKSFGIGLALARMIIVEQRGTIKAENRQPNGALFTIRFFKGP